MPEKLRLKQSSVCEMLDITPQTIRDLLATDSSFPTPLKNGNKRQSALYFDYSEIVEWHESQKRKRYPEIEK